MHNNYHKITAIILAFLVLFSTTGISMNVILCHCTGQQYLSSFLSNTSCCTKKEAPLQGNSSSCCSQNSIASCSKDGESSIKNGKKCCSSSFKYAKSNINLDLAASPVLPVLPVFLALTPTLTTILYSYNNILVIADNYAVIANPNKAPPKPFGQILLQLIQNYRC